MIAKLLPLAACLFVAACAVAQASKPAPDTVREHLWIWCHEAGCNNGLFGIEGQSRMTPAEAAFYLGVPNALMVVFGGKPEPPFDMLARSMRPLNHVVWSIVGDSSSTRNDKATDLEAVKALADRFPNISGGIMDDFFHPADASGAISRYSVADISGFRDALRKGDRKLDLWVVLYSHQLDLPVTEHLAACDVVTFWTWSAADLKDLENNFERFEKLAPGKRKILGCYMWDFGSGKPMPRESMKRQAELGLKWLKSGRIDGIIFLSSVICDLDLEAVEWTRKWIAEIGATKL